MKKRILGITPEGYIYRNIILNLFTTNPDKIFRNSELKKEIEKTLEKEFSPTTLSEILKLLETLGAIEQVNGGYKSHQYRSKEEGDSKLHEIVEKIITDDTIPVEMRAIMVAPYYIDRANLIFSILTRFGLTDPNHTFENLTIQIMVNFSRILIDSFKTDEERELFLRILSAAMFQLMDNPYEKILNNYKSYLLREVNPPPKPTQEFEQSGIIQIHMPKKFKKHVEKTDPELSKEIQWYESSDSSSSKTSDKNSSNDTVKI